MPISPPSLAGTFFFPLFHFGPNSFPFVKGHSLQIHPSILEPTAGTSKSGPGKKGAAVYPNFSLLIAILTPAGPIYVFLSSQFIQLTFPFRKKLNF
jgi:hypothetical protein